MGRTVCGFVSRPPRTVYSWEREQKYNVGECVHEKKQKGSEAWHAGERTKPGLAAQRVGWIEYSPVPAKGELEVSSTLLMERSRASQPRQSKTFVEKAMEDNIKDAVVKGRSQDLHLSQSGEEVEGESENEDVTYDQMDSNILCWQLTFDPEQGYRTLAENGTLAEI